jgi:two-component system chemotaxis response regulator CheY
MRILIVDDSVVMRKIVEGALRHAGLELTEAQHAANGAEGLAALEDAAARGELFDLILCDVHMPVLDGLGFLREKSQRNLGPGTPVVMITADSSDPHLLQAIDAGAQGYIAKPFTLEQVQTRVASLLSSAAGNASSHHSLPPTSPAAHTLGGR